VVSNPTTKVRSSKKKLTDLEERGVLVETAVTALHFEWWLSSLRRHERCWSSGHDIVLPSMLPVVH
jgi:hypothetical protein